MRASRQGLSLIEILIAFAIIGIVFLALAMSQILGLRTTRGTLEASAARDIASRQMEEIRSYGYFSYKDCPAKEPPFSSAPRCGETAKTVADQPHYQLSWQVTARPPDPADPTKVLALSPPPLVGIGVIVSWGEQRYHLYSYLSCADAGAFSSTNVPCPKDSMRPL